MNKKSPQTNPSVLFLVGMPGAGKSTCVDHIILKNIPSVYFGGVIVEEAIKRGNGQTSPELEKIVREELRNREGMGAVAKRIIPKIDALLAENDRVVADGLYSWAEYKMIKQHYGDKSLVIAITAPRHVRHQRLAHRPVRPLTPEEATSREYAEIENIEKGGPIANADYTISNSNDPMDMLHQLDHILKETGFLK